MSARVVAGLSLVAFLVSLSGRGLCFMKMAAPAAEATQSKHDCCRTGLQGLPPACCMSLLTAEAPARVVKRHGASAPTSIGYFPEPRPTPVVLQHRPLFRARGDRHLADPPPLTLRI
ncbi:MAG: hypothetical protein DMF80_05525 [Acidobacteria bacterium]|nr:MAG: hypothetical protein DMF80_05525 [Acidobacteriota bacterium]